MDTFTSGAWIADLDAMLCCNVNNRVVVEFEKKGEAVVGQVKDMPFELLAKWAEKPDGRRRMQEMVIEAEGVFLNAYFESLQEKNEPAKG